MKWIYFTAAFAMLSFSIPTNAWAAPADSADPKVKAAGGDAAAPSDAHPNAQPPNAQAGPKFYASPGPEQRKQIESLSRGGTTSTQSDDSGKTLPSSPSDQKLYMTPGPDERQQIESLSRSGEDSGAQPDAPAAPKFYVSPGPDLRKQIEALSGSGKSGSEKCEAIRAKAVKCLREATAKEEWSDICRPHIDEYVTRCKRTDTK